MTSLPTFCTPVFHASFASVTLGGRTETESSFGVRESGRMERATSLREKSGTVGVGRRAFWRILMVGWKGMCHEWGMHQFNVSPDLGQQGGRFPPRFADIPGEPFAAVEHLIQTWTAEDSMPWSPAAHLLYCASEFSKRCPRLGRNSTCCGQKELRHHAVAITNGRIVAIGSTSWIGALGGPQTQIVDLGGRRVIPGLVDTHNHGVKGCLATLFACKFPFSVTPKDLEDALNDFMDRNPQVQFVMGGRYGSDFLSKYAHELVPTPREWLDARSRGRAVYLREYSGHDGWTNSKALEHFGITKDSPDPKGGKIVRDPQTGEPSGPMVEEADVKARAAWPDWTPEQYRTAVLELVKIANGFGITGSTDADANEGILRAFKEADDQKKLSLWIAAAQTTPYGHREEPLDYSHFERWRDTFASAHVDTRFIKIYLDGVPLNDSRTAFMVEPYTPDPHGRFPHDHRGSAHVPPPVLARDLVELDCRGFTVKTHCCGDGSVRAWLDAIQAARQANGDSGLRHEVAHTSIVTKEDVPRFRELNAVAELSPYLWSGEGCVGDTRKCVDAERIARWYPTRELLEAGATITAGSDWPAAVASMNPWLGLASLVTRRDPTSPTVPAIAPDQAISMEQALEIFTVQGARALRRDGLTGSIEEGKSADLVVLDRDIFKVPPDDVAFTQVEMTFFEGKLVFERKPSNDTAPPPPTTIGIPPDPKAPIAPQTAGGSSSTYGTIPLPEKQEISSGSSFCGFAVGYFGKKLGQGTINEIPWSDQTDGFMYYIIATLFFIGGLILFLSYLRYIGFIEIHWDVISESFKQRLDINGDGVLDFKDMQAGYAEFLKWIASTGFPVTAAFTGGIVLGLHSSRLCDYVAMSVGYNWPDECSPEIKSKVKTFFEEIQPDLDQRPYPFTYLSTMLHGSTQDEIFTIFNGRTRNGKSVLADLMKETLGDYCVMVDSKMATADRPMSGAPSQIYWN
ncbi:hypothetical protein M427DRAFT_145127 [Gonapodya prolifera JEL478]|uniref:Amidohydrolase 3 domain-containing protein n=1 Tax=Gonapodya prolifera (strain JEL478) TaxID=1344416 RepID=A0A139AH78_GONPJ|nr:hypothetical protein M427DRAFT_145127 [Gonapodya prolifera JEL478]|eukprot:KXS16156.1 hypothetical protein M427DRAFT_145127 [Gonapodya prolifera JEL478]